MKPIWHHRELVGYAKTAKQAERIIRNKHQSIPKGWRVVVRERDTSIIELPAGFIYTITYTY